MIPLSVSKIYYILYHFVKLTIKVIPPARAFFKNFSVEGPSSKRDFTMTCEEMKGWQNVPFFGGSRDPPSKRFVFLSCPDLISCNFSMIFTNFPTKRDFYWVGGENPSVGGQHRGWWGFGPSSIYVKKGPASCTRFCY